jgi:hypothetical protein
MPREPLEIYGKAGDLGAAAHVRAKLARASSLRKLPEGGDFPEAPAQSAGELHSFEVNKVLDTFNALFPGRPWKHTSARKEHVDLFGEVIKNGEIYYQQHVGAGWGDFDELMWKDVAETGKRE